MDSKTAGNGNGSQSLGTRLYRNAVRPLLFMHNPETAHSMAKTFLRHSFPMSMMRGYLDAGNGTLEANLGGKVKLKGPIGNAAGFDKDAEMIPGLAQMFDFVTVGTILPYEWAGNPKYRSDATGIWSGTGRIVRLVKEEALLNCLGFPFSGPKGAIARIEAYSGGVPINASVAVRPIEGESQQLAITQFEGMLGRMAHLVPSKIKIIEPNFASPNTKGLSVFFEGGTFDRIARLLTQRPFNSALLLLKMPPHIDHAGRERNLRVAARWMDLGGDGITAINTLRTQDSRLSMGAGGKSGRPLFDLMVRNLEDYRNLLGSKAVIMACGGVTPDKVSGLAGGLANAVQIFTPFIYDGPCVVRDLKKALRKEVDRTGLFLS